MIEQQMAQAADEMLRKLMSMAGGMATGSAKANLIALQWAVEKGEGLMSEQLAMFVNRSDMKEYEMAFKDVGLSYSKELVEGEDRFAITFNEKDGEKYQAALDLIERGRSTINERPLADFIKNNKEDALEMVEPLDAIELDRFRDHANRGDLIYSVFISEKKSFSADKGPIYGIVYNKVQEESFKDAIGRTYEDFARDEGKAEHQRVKLQLAVRNVAETELNKDNTEFVVLDVAEPKTYMLVKETGWDRYHKGALIRTNQNESEQLHKEDVLSQIQNMNQPLIMSVEEYRNKHVLTGLIEDSGYLKPVDEKLYQAGISRVTPDGYQLTPKLPPSKEELEMEAEMEELIHEISRLSNKVEVDLPSLAYEKPHETLTEEKETLKNNRIKLASLTDKHKELKRAQSIKAEVDARVENLERRVLSKEEKEERIDSVFKKDIDRAKQAQIQARKNAKDKNVADPNITR